MKNNSALMWMQRPSLITTGPCLYAPFRFPKRVTQLVVTLSGWGPIFREQRRLVRRGREPVTHSCQNLHFSTRSWDDHRIEVRTREGTLVGGTYSWSLNSAGVRVPYFLKNPSVTRVSPPHTGFPTSELTLSNTGLSCMGQWNCHQLGEVGGEMVYVDLRSSNRGCSRVSCITWVAS